MNCIRHTQRGPAIRLLASLLLTASLALPARAQQTVETPLAFATEAQPLFGGDAGYREVIELSLPFFEERIPPTTKGSIERVTEDIPVETLQRIWQQAIDKCTAQGYTVPVIGTRISPTVTECINGEIRRNYCTLPPKLGWGSCPGFAQETFVRDLGRGIGPKPTQPAPRPFDVGAIVTYRADVEMGVRGAVVFDAGTVDVAFAGNARLQTSASEAAPGDVVTITTGWDLATPSADLVSRYPNIDFALGSYVFMDAHAEVEYAAPDMESGDQVRGKKVLYDKKTLDSDLENVGADGIVEFADTEWFGVNISLAGLQVRVKEEGFTVVDGSTLFSDNVLYPFQPKPRPVGAAGFSLADYSLLSPKLDTPVPNGYTCGECENPPLRNFVDPDGNIVNTAPTGTRTIIEGLIGEDGLQSPAVGNGLQDSDFFRFDLDIDSLSLAVGAPLGVTVEGPLVKMPKRIFKGKDIGPIIGVNLDVVDMDVASFWSADQELTFDPNVSVELSFDKSVEVRLEGEQDFTATQRVTIRLGSSLEFRQPEGGVRITPTYTARHNRFTNDTTLLLTLAYQQKMGGVELYGVAPDLAAGVFDLPTNFAISQITPQFADPIRIWSSQPDDGSVESYGLGGFTDIAGAAISVTAPGSGGGNSGGGNSGGGSGSGNGGQDGGGSGGGGSLGPLGFTGLLLLAMALSILSRSAKAGRGRTHWIEASGDGNEWCGAGQRPLLSGRSSCRSTRRKGGKKGRLAPEYSRFRQSISS